MLGKYRKERNGGLASHIHKESGFLSEAPVHLDKKQYKTDTSSLCTKQKDNNNFRA